MPLMLLWNLNVYVENFSRFNNVIGPHVSLWSANAVLLGLTTSSSLAPLSYSYLRAREHDNLR